MSTKWISNTIYVHGFNNIAHLFAFMLAFRDHPRNEEGIIVPESGVIDVDYLTVNISSIQSGLRLSVSFLTDHNLAHANITRMYPEGFDQLKLTYALIDTRNDAVELYTYTGKKLSSHKEVPKGLGSTLREELERLPDPDKNLSFSLNDLDLMDYEEFAAKLSAVFPEYAAQ